MATFMTALVSELHSHARSDPEYFLPSHTRVEADLKSIPTLPLRKLGQFSCSAFYPAATHLYTSEGIPFLRCVDIVNFPLISPDQPFARIPDDFVNAHSTIRNLKAGDIVISKVGSPCYAALLSDDMPLSAMTRTVLGISDIDESMIDPYYLVAFLRSRYGFDQLMRERELTIQYQLTLERTRKIRVFLPERPIQKMVGDMVRGYYKCSRDSLCSYDAAQQLLESELGLDELTLQKPVGYTARFSDLETARRSDAEYFDPVATTIVDRIRSFQNATLGNSFFIRNGFPWSSKKFREDNSGEPVVRIRNIRPSHIDTDELTSIEPDYAARIGFAKAKKGDAVIGMDGIKYFNASLLEGDCYINQRVAHLTQKPGSIISPEYATFLINSRIGQTQLLRDMTIATTVGHITSRNISKLIVPYVSVGFHREITALVRNSIDKQQESKKLLEQAKARVEQLIEEAARA